MGMHKILLECNCDIVFKGVWWLKKYKTWLYNWAHPFIMGHMTVLRITNHIQLVFNMI